ncbi:uncharacterized protein LOC108734939 [Agrilus planipennis]|uniref:Uncharacterized protein LOC108734939 n=1 Tax=Agrilus planipennis TaxID=224129 RepID=A0A7F5RA70_AGRPL|nr:uncharacterized protein LOC112905175 [Agrilus planipennis]XP_025834036.1 uncharacterized protein LOC108734939 [Agrilus planipennis]
MASSEASGSHSVEEIPDSSLHSDFSKQRLKDGVVYYENLLLENDLIMESSSDTLSEDAMLIGRELYNSTLDVLSEKKFISDEELIHAQEECIEGNFEAIADDSHDDYVPDEKKFKKSDFITLEYKIKVLNVAKAHPTWKLDTLQKHGCGHLKRMDHLKVWEKDVEQGGTKFDKFHVIDSWTYDRFVEMRRNYKQVTTRNLQQWALAAASQFPDLQFKASNRWVAKFKQRHNICQRKITRFVSEKETYSIETILASAETFRLQTKQLISNFNSDFIINTDQTGCQYQSHFNRTLTDKGSKTVFANVQDMNKLSHTYTAQYSITLSGKLLPQVFICLQEPTGDFGPRIKQHVEEYVKKYRNVVVTSSKSGKLTTILYKKFLVKSLMPYVQKNKFLLLVDSWTGQTRAELYDEIFQDEEKMPTCTTKIIPPKCTPLVQPCDVYFYRQVKNFIKRLQSTADLLDKNYEIHSREDCLKIHSIVHHQLSAPIFHQMIQYAWFASGLCDTKKFFTNVNQACFSLDLLKTHCNCNKTAFICRSWCRKNVCFECFYHNYHSGSCTPDC